MPGAGESEVADLAAAVRDTYRAAEDSLLDVVAEEARRTWQRNLKPDRRRRSEVVDQAQAAARVGAHAARIAKRLEAQAPAVADEVTRVAAERGERAARRELDTLLGRQSRRDRGSAPGRSPELVRASRGLVDALSPAHSSILRTTRDAYRDAVADTLGPYSSGAIGREEMARRAMATLGDQGVTEFRDRAGRRWELASYVEQATRAASARVMVDSLVDRSAASGTRLFYVPDVQGECALCRPWEGEILSADGSLVGEVEVENVLTSEPMTIEVKASLAEARAAGFLHPSCRHGVSPFVPGASRPPTNTADPQGERDRERLRALERHVRHWKRREAAAFDQVGRAQAKAKVRDWQAAIRDHTKSTGLIRQPKRERVGPGVVR
ncbi:phage minor capsid protein [Actinomycetospora aeridis]|uniref:Phage minor capsid protein n=1 Tax=Actinomycetospora aeridis TaxID=3129231 RepID=A0ABU8N1A9_9PSEU